MPSAPGLEPDAPSRCLENLPPDDSEAAPQHEVEISLAYCLKILIRKVLRESPPPDDAAAPLTRLVAKKRGKEFLINAADVDWIEASGNYANLHHPDGVYPVRASMTELQRRLEGGQFARVHRSYIVNLDRTGEIEPTDGGDYLIHMKDGATVRFSRRYRAELKGRLVL